jgi:tripartite-type tricarboxylate transporter receptor subunit TctC
MAGVYLVSPYRGSSGAHTDVIGEQVDVMFVAVTTMAEQIKSSRDRHGYAPCEPLNGRARCNPR